MANPYAGLISFWHWQGKAIGENTIDEVIATIKGWAPHARGVWVKTSNGTVWQGVFDTKPDLAINGPQDFIDEMRARYRRRRDVVIDGLRLAGWDVPRPEASMFVWAPVPPDYAALGSLGFSKLLLERAGVAVAPGIGFGEHGDGYVRLALVENEQRIRQAARGLRKFFDSADSHLHNVVPIKAAG